MLSRIMLNSGWILVVVYASNRDHGLERTRSAAGERVRALARNRIGIPIGECTTNCWKRERRVVKKSELFAVKERRRAFGSRASGNTA